MIVTKLPEIMMRFGKSYTVQPNEITLAKIKTEKYKSLEGKCIELRRILQEMVFDALKYRIKEIVFDFILSEDNTFKFLQIKDYYPVQLANETDKMLRLTNRDRKGLKQLDDCEGHICTFGSNAQVEKILTVLNRFNLIRKKHCTKGKVAVSSDLVVQYTEDMAIQRYITY